MFRIKHWNAVAILAATSLLFVALAPASVGAQSEPMRFGMNLSSIDAQTNAGVKPDMGMIWIGPWTLQSGWGGPDKELQKAYSMGVTPVIQFYYWGDDISQACIEKGCKSSLHAAEKNKANWTKLAEQLSQHLNTNMKGRKVIIILETEFNKNDVSTYEPLDGYLAEKAEHFKRTYSGSEVVMGLGNWGHAQWGTWDRTAAASHATGIQGMRGSTKNSQSSYLSLAQSTLDGAKQLRDRFQKPIYITDIALSSYPEPDYLPLQKSALEPFFARMSEFKALGVKGMLYRGYLDSPNMDTKNYFGQAERHWGLAWANNHTHKPSMKVWIDGVKKERGTPSSSTPAPPPPPPPFAPTFQIKAPNEWWQEVFIQNAEGHTIARVDVRMDGGAWKTMSKSSWGAWTSSYNAKAGTRVEFLATSSAGAKAQSQAFTWLDGQTTKGTASGTEAKPAFAPTFQIKAPNEWWQEVFIEDAGTRTVARVDVRLDGGAWKTMSKSSWGAWTSSYNAKAGTQVEFRATATDGATAQSEAFTWLDGQTRKGTAGATQPSPTPSPSPTPTTSSSTPTPTTSSSTPSPTPSPTTTSSSPAPTTTAAPTTTTPKPAYPLTVLSKEAEVFTTKSTGASGIDETASAGKYWKLDENGHVAQGFTSAQGMHRITVWARGEAFMSDAPRMQVVIDGQVVMDLAITSTSWTAYTVDRTLADGSHTIRIAYTNDASSILSDRNLLLDRALVQQTA